MPEKNRNKLFLMRWLIILLALSPWAVRPAFAYVIPAWKIVQMSQEKNRPIKNLQVSRRTMVFDRIFPGGKAEIQEMLYYDPAKGFRAEMKLPSGEKIFVDDGQSTITILNNRIIEENSSKGNLLQLFFKRNTPEEIHQSLKEAGIDASKVSLGRLSGRVVIIIGAKPGDLIQPQIWIDKEQLFLLRVIGRDHLYSDRAFVAREFSDYFQVDGLVWFPKIFRAFDGNVLTRTSSVIQAKVNNTLPPELFDISRIIAVTPYGEKKVPESSESTDLPYPALETDDEEVFNADKLLNDFREIIRIESNEDKTSSP